MVKFFRLKPRRDIEPLKRGRGRPRKYPLPEAVDVPRRKLPDFVNQKFLLAALIILLALVPSIYFYKQNQDTKKKLGETTSQQKSDEVGQTIDKVSKHALLPTNEQPTVATVTDVSKLAGQEFFANAQTGDKVLVYTKARKAILYRPSIDKIVEMAPLNTEAPVSQPQQ